MDREQIKQTAFRNDEDIYNKNIEPTPIPQKEIGIDLDDTLLSNIVSSTESGQFDVNVVNSFTQVSRNRDVIYSTLDAMGDDSTLSAVLETYAEDATETNDQGTIMWVESEDPNISKFINYLLDSFNVDKNIYKWAHSLCKYGDVYLRIYRESDYQDYFFDNLNQDDKTLNEDVKIKAYSKSDKYVHYLEQIDNPAQMFELTRYGKTIGYIKTDVKATSNDGLDDLTTNQFTSRLSFNANDVELYPPTEFVHGCLEDSLSRVEEVVDLFTTDDEDKKTSYKVKRGQSLLASVYTVWRQLQLLENSVLLNRVTQSAIVRVIQVEVGDMPKENIAIKMQDVKHLIEQKAAINVGNSMSEYTNPGPIINNVYIPTRGNQGVITTQQIGGDVNIGDLVDLDYYEDKLFGSLRVPKQYFGRTDDNAGFSGSQSLSIISSRYAKMIKRIQNILIQMVTDAINLILINTGNDSYINRFKLRMQAPTTQEETDRHTNLANKIGLVRDVMDISADVDDPITRLKMLKSLLSSTISDETVLQLIQDQIDLKEQENITSEEPSAEEVGDFSDTEPLDIGTEGDFSDFGSDASYEDSYSEEPTSSETQPSDDVLPAPEDLGAGDMSDMTNPSLQ